MATSRKTLCQHGVSTLLMFPSLSYSDTSVSEEVAFIHNYDMFPTCNRTLQYMFLVSAPLDRWYMSSWHQVDFCDCIKHNIPIGGYYVVSELCHKRHGLSSLLGKCSLLIPLSSLSSVQLSRGRHQQNDRDTNQLPRRAPAREGREEKRGRRGRGKIGEEKSIEEGEGG